MKACAPAAAEKNVDDALKNPGVVSVANVVVFQRTGKPGYWQEGRDLWWHELTQASPPTARRKK